MKTFENHLHGHLSATTLYEALRSTEFEQCHFLTNLLRFHLVSFRTLLWRSYKLGKQVLYGCRILSFHFDQHFLRIVERVLKSSVRSRSIADKNKKLGHMTRELAKPVSTLGIDSNYHTDLVYKFISCFLCINFFPSTAKVEHSEFLFSNPRCNSCCK